MNKSFGVHSTCKNRVSKNNFVARVSVVLFAIAVAWIVIMPKVAVSAAPEKFVTYTVRPGDTLWGYAASITDKNGNVSDTVEHLAEINNLSSYDLQVGQTINVPVLNSDK